MCVMLGIDGLVDPLATYATMSGTMPNSLFIKGIAMLHFVAPASSACSSTD